MNNGFSASNPPKKAQSQGSATPAPRWLVSGLGFGRVGTRIALGTLLGMAFISRPAVAQGPTVQPQAQPSDADTAPATEPIAEPTVESTVEPAAESEDALPSILPDSPSVEPDPAAPPIANPSTPAPPQPTFSAPLPSQPTNATFGTDQIPTLPPQSGPRFEQPLIRPNAVAPTISPSFEDYHLGPGDAIFVSVQRYPDLSFQATLDLQGNVIVPIQGSVNLEGLTLDETESLMRGIYNQYVVIRENRDVAITLVGRRGVEVTILGAVERPGFYPLADPSVATALLTAGGATQTSDLRDIQVQRQLRRQGGIVQETVNVDLFTPLKEGGPLPDVRLEDGDVLVIPELDPNELDEYDSFLVARSTLAQPVINVRFLNYAGGRGGVGTLNLNNGSSFLDAITVLGVNPDNANLGDVALIRYDPETGRAITVSLDAKSAILGDITQDPPLQDNDVVVVGRNLIGRLSFALQTITRPFRDVFGFTRFLDDALNDGLFN